MEGGLVTPVTTTSECGPTLIGALRAMTSVKPLSAGLELNTRSSYQPFATVAGSASWSVPAAAPVVTHDATMFVLSDKPPRMYRFRRSPALGAGRPFHDAVSVPPGEMSVGVAVTLTR